jgi:sugar/nucleoside kinase (ribokinase family)
MLLAVGSVAFDSVRTPFGERERMLGGSAVHFSLAASLFTDVGIVGRVGDDFGDAELEVLHGRGVDTSKLERIDGGKTFFWRGHYEYDLNMAYTDETELGVFADFQPDLSGRAADVELLFLGNIQPELQSHVRGQCDQAKLVALDSMNLWIETAHDALVGAIAGVDMVFMNDAEIRMLTEEPNLVRAARAVMEMGPAVVVAKQGEYGAALFTREGFFALPAYPLETVADPTGAGDSFAGGFLGYLASEDGAHDDGALRRGMAYGTTVASFCVEGFGTERLESVTRDEVEERAAAIAAMTRIEGTQASLP